MEPFGSNLPSMWYVTKQHLERGIILFKPPIHVICNLKHIERGIILFKPPINVICNLTTPWPWNHSIKTSHPCDLQLNNTLSEESFCSNLPSMWSVTEQHLERGIILFTPPIHVICNLTTHWAWNHSVHTSYPCDLQLNNTLSVESFCSNLPSMFWSITYQQKTHLTLHPHA